MTQVLSLRQPDLRVVLEEVKNSHNANAVVRTCDAAGILHIDVISSSGEPLPINKAISTRADKWIHFHYYRSASECLSRLRKKGLKIVATHLDENALSHDSLDYTQPLAIVFGNEAEGISEETLKMSDYRIKIPMLGMAHSLNLSVSAGIILYEALKQRQKKGFFKKRRLPSKEFDRYLKLWLRR
ncbi:MAG: RNA methyltransferase [Candidatus Aminicenantales bacterium]